MAKTSLVVVVTLLLSGCWSLAPRYERPPLELPASWAGSADTSASSISVQWWKIYADALLDQLVEEAFAHNADLALAVARVDEARALAGYARSELFPFVDAGAERSRTQSSLRTNTPLPPGTERKTDSYRAGLNVNFELDLWGRLRDASSAARAEVLATQAARETVRLAVAAEVTQGYFALRAYDEQIVATRRSIDTRGEALTLQKLRYEAGVISEFEYRQLEAEVLAARAQLPGIERSRIQQENALALLLGKSPRVIYESATIEAVAPSDSAPTLPATIVPPGLPSELLLRRPDLVEAEQRLIAAQARIGVARAAYFPSISLTGFYGSESALLSDLFTGPAGTWKAGAALTQPIFGFGRATRLVDAANARQRQAVAQYQRAIQNAFREARDAIVAQTKTREQFEAEEQRVAALTQSLRLAELRYRNGITSQLEMLDAERNLLSARLNRSEALRAQRAAIADLFKSLGGGWEFKQVSP